MANLVKKVKDIISYWYLRYLLAIELYMVEPWERAVIHVLFLVIFILFWYFNSTIVLGAISRLRISTPTLKEVK